MFLIANGTADWLTAVGTLATAVVAVGVAVGLQWWTSHAERRKAPELTLERDELWFASEIGWPRLRLAVRNAVGKHAATDVQVSVEVITEANSGVFYRPPNMTLPWSNIYDRELVLRPVTVPAGGKRYVDLGSFVDRSHPDAVGRPAFQVAARTGGLGDKCLLDSPCTFELTISASNCDVNTWRAVMRFEPSDGERKKPMNVQLGVERGWELRGEARADRAVGEVP